MSNRILCASAIIIGLMAEVGAVNAQNEAAPAGTVLWTYQAGGQLWSSLAYSEGALFFGSDDGTVTALEVNTQGVRWQFATGGRIRSASIVAAGAVLFASDDGFLYAVETGSGEERWRFNLGGVGLERRLPAQGPPYDYDYRHSSPTSVGGLIYIGSADGSLYAVEMTTGEQRWRFATGGKIRSSPTVAGGMVYFGSWDGNVYALDAANGSEVWRHSTGGSIQSSPSVVDGKVYIGSRSARILALNAETGTPVWTHVLEDGSWVESSPVVVDGVLYVGTSDHLKLLALDAETGAVVWQFRTGGWSWGDPVVAHGRVYIGSVSAFPYYFEGIDLEPGAYAVDASTGAERWRIVPAPIDGYVTGGVFAGVQVVEGVVYLGSIDGVIRAVKE